MRGARPGVPRARGAGGVSQRITRRARIRITPATLPTPRASHRPNADRRADGGRAFEIAASNMKRRKASIVDEYIVADLEVRTDDVSHKGMLA